LEVKRRIETAIAEKLKGMMTKSSVDEDDKALKTFIEYR